MSDFYVSGEHFADTRPCYVCAVVRDKSETDGRTFRGVETTARETRASSYHVCRFDEDEVGDTGVVHVQRSELGTCLHEWNHTRVAKIFAVGDAEVGEVLYAGRTR